jgi:hypothetical protein
MLADKDVRNRRFVVLVNLADEVFSCVCCKFEKDGIVCSHILCLLMHLNMSQLPEKYYVERWKPKENKYVRDKQFNVPVDLTSGNKHMRFQLLSNRLIDMASEAAKTNEKYLYVVKEAMKIEEGLDEMNKAEELQRQKSNESAEKNPSDAQHRAPHPDGYGDSLENPDIAPSKGRPHIQGRHKTLMETLLTKQQITCSHCGSHNHNIATCDKLHLPKTDFPSKKTRPKKKAVAGMISFYMIMNLIKVVCALVFELICLKIYCRQ